MKYKKIAVIGLSGRFSGAENKREFRKILNDKKVQISDPPKHRLELVKLNAEAEYMKCAYIEDIERFDNDFFGVPAREARLMSPEHRMSLELVAEAILDAGYSLSEFRGSLCGVYIACINSEYNQMIKKQSSTSIIGSEAYMLSGRIGYQFDLRGSNYTINSACSSSMTALNMACEKLTLGEIESAVVGGITLFINVPRAKENIYDAMGIISDDYTLNSFDQRSDGTVMGEGGAYVLLKPLDEAIKANDHIYGVIVSGAVNGDGGRCSNVSMPSMEAQRDVVIDAWKDAEIENLTEVETHGIGAMVGDAVEAESLNRAVKKYGLSDKRLLMSTLKPNIGHLFVASGISSFIKILIGYENDETYPIANFECLNDMVNFDESGLELVHKTYKWPKDSKRMTGVSCFGLSGCNTHLVVENYLEERDEEVKSKAKVPVKISARTKEAFKAQAKSITDYIREENSRFDDITLTMNVGRDDYEYRALIEAGSCEELSDKLASVEPYELIDGGEKILTVCAIKTTTDDVNSILNACRKYEELKKSGIRIDLLLIDKGIKSALEYMKGKKSKDVFLNEMSSMTPDLNSEGFEKQIASRQKSGVKTLVFDLSPDRLSWRNSSDESIKIVFSSKDESNIEVLNECYKAGMDIKWNNLVIEGGKRISIPSYPFSKKKIWLKDTDLAIEDKEDHSLSLVESRLLNTVKLRVVFASFGENVESVNLHKAPYNNRLFREGFYPVTGAIDADYKLAMLRYIEKHNIRPDVFISDRLGLAIYKYWRGWINDESLRDAILNMDSDRESEVHNAKEKILDMSKEGPILVLDFSKSGLFKELDTGENIIVLNLFEERERRAAIEDRGTHALGISGIDENIDVDSLNEKRDAVIEKSEEQLKAEEFLMNLWSSALNINEEIKKEDDFFALGGNSLVMQSMSDKINEHFSKKFDIFEIYDNETIEKLAATILAA